MQTDLPAELLATDKGQRAEEILRSCVHCGFCNATCPTYQVTGDELDGPRGRIYLIKEMLEADAPNARGQRHLDRCLTCRACETTCPSGVAYGELLEIGREFVEPASERTWRERKLRELLLWLVPNPNRFRFWTGIGRTFSWFVPNPWRQQLPPAQTPGAVADSVDDAQAAARVLLLDGCVQQAATPQTNVALRNLLHQRGVATRQLQGAQCCGGANLHLADVSGAHEHMRVLLRAVEPHLDEVDVIVSSASGCGVTLKDFDRLLADDPEYVDLARRFVAKLRDVAEYLADLGPFHALGEPQRVAVQAPCTLQHGQRLNGVVERLLAEAGHEVLPLQDPHLCCGSAGTYSMTQPQLSEALRRRKLDSLHAAQPDVIATANVGCQIHLATGAQVPVHHWLELIE